jgi:PAS domain-containing protein
MWERAYVIFFAFLAGSRGARPPDTPNSLADAKAVALPTRSTAAQSIVDALPDAALVLDATARILAANAAAHDIMGRVLIGDHVGRTARHPELADAIRTTVATGEKSSFVMTQIVKHIAVRHRGRVEVSLTLGAGTTFSLVFPLHDSR